MEDYLLKVVPDAAQSCTKKAFRKSRVKYSKPERSAVQDPVSVVRTRFLPVWRQSHGCSRQRTRPAPENDPQTSTCGSDNAKFVHFLKH